MGDIIAVTGSSWFAGRGLGSLIDSFDDVVRFNDHPQKMQGYEKDIGKKTTIWVGGDWLEPEFINGKGDWREPDFINNVFTFRRIFCRAISPAPPYPEWRGEIISQGEVQELMSMLKQPSCWPTTGMLGLWHLMQQFSPITTAGWWKEPGQMLSYLWPAPAPDLNWHGSFRHYPELENVLYLKWIEEGRIVELAY